MGPRGMKSLSSALWWFYEFGQRQRQRDQCSHYRQASMLDVRTAQTLSGEEDTGFPLTRGAVVSTHATLAISGPLGPNVAMLCTVPRRNGTGPTTLPVLRHQAAV